MSRERLIGDDTHSNNVVPAFAMNMERLARAPLRIYRTVGECGRGLGAPESRIPSSRTLLLRHHLVAGPEERHDHPVE